ncbi:MAG: response regulator transcription factor [Acidimicrobiia bacterium]|nr:response regulator transcription factor [Acidimicrobiia bacterium]
MTDAADKIDQPVRLLLADDHRMLRESLRRAMEDNGFDVVGEAPDGAEAVRLAEELRPDVILMDVTMPVLDGVEATRQVRDRVPGTQVVILTMHADKEVLVDAIRAGAAGYLVKDCSTEEVVETVRKAAAGETALSAELAASMLGEVRDLVQREEAGAEPIISKREEEVLQLIADGLSTTEVAAKLYISVKTVKNHLASIYQKLDTRDRTQAVLQAVRMGIVRLD